MHASGVLSQFGNVESYGELWWKASTGNGSEPMSRQTDRQAELGRNESSKQKSAGFTSKVAFGDVYWKPSPLKKHSSSAMEDSSDVVVSIETSWYRKHIYIYMPPASQRAPPF